MASEGVPFAGYHLLRRLGAGGTSEVFLARPRGELRTLVALKRLKPALSEDRAFTTALLDEAWLLTQLAHPHLVRLLDVGQHRAHVYLVLEYLHGVSTAELVTRQGALPWPWVVRVGVQLAEALEYLHTRVLADGRAPQLAHGDVSPENVLCALNGEVKLIDLGMSAGARARLRKLTGASFANVAYAAPEVLERGRADASADVFSLGATLHHLLCGSAPFSAERTPASKPSSLKEPAGSKWPRGLAKWVSACMAPRREDRAASARAVRLELEFFSRSAPPVGLPELAEPVAAFFPNAGRLVLSADREAQTERGRSTRRLKEDSTR